jgi:ribosomal 30S subunit maturation factor RimM
MEYVRLGQVSKTFGLEGQVRVFSLTDFAAKAFQNRQQSLAYLTKRRMSGRTLTLRASAIPAIPISLGFEEIPNIDEARKSSVDYVEIDKALAPLPKGYYRLEDLKGCAILDDEGQESLRQSQRYPFLRPNQNLGGLPRRRQAVLRSFRDGRIHPHD